jgi:hypothetical protein
LINRPTAGPDHLSDAVGASGQHTGGHLVLRSPHRRRKAAYNKFVIDGDKTYAVRLKVAERTAVPPRWHPFSVPSRFLGARNDFFGHSWHRE